LYQWREVWEHLIRRNAIADGKEHRILRLLRGHKLRTICLKGKGDR
jgi:hypothetical protein